MINIQKIKHRTNKIQFLNIIKMKSKTKLRILYILLCLVIFVVLLFIVEYLFQRNERLLRKVPKTSKNDMVDVRDRIWKYEEDLRIDSWRDRNESNKIPMLYSPPEFDNQ